MAFLPPSIRALLIRHAAQWMAQSGKILRRLWLEITGAVFLGLAIFAVPAVLQEWRAYQEGASVLRPLAVLVFLVIMASFGVYSFVKSRRYR